jgi:hypothetical protein
MPGHYDKVGKGYAGLGKKELDNCWLWTWYERISTSIKASR